MRKKFRGTFYIDGKGNIKFESDVLEDVVREAVKINPNSGFISYDGSLDEAATKALASSLGLKVARVSNKFRTISLEPAAPVEKK